SLRATRSEGQPPETQLAHYLLRTNTAFQLSGLMPYLPHSNRVRFVMRKMGVRLSGEQDPGVNLLRVTEQSFPAEVPLILSVVLSGATNPGDVLPRALALREEKSVRKYRRWSDELMQAWSSDDEERKEAAKHEFQEAKDALGTELQKLRARKAVGSRLWRYLKEVLPDTASVQKRPEVLRRIMTEGENWLLGLRPKRRIAILIELADRSLTSGFHQLNDDLSRVFGNRNRLTGQELENLHFLRSEKI
ncbi:MAG: hypothetical protein ABI995_10690, partial [Acidobacteriota bacterium]